MGRLLLALMLGVALSGCSPVAMLNTTISTQGLLIARDIPYEPGPRHSLDLYRPDASAGALPVAVFLYGGSWKYGSKDDYLFLAGELARRGILVAVPDYRLYPQVGFPDFVRDAAQAVAYVRRVAPSWGGDPNRVFVVGHSAGAHIGALLALDPEYLAAAGDSRDNLAGFVGLSGPYDFLPIQDPKIREVFGPAADSPTTQPITYADRNAPPMLLLQGDADTTVYPRNATSLASRINAAGGRAELKIYPGVGHIGIVLGFAPDFRSRSPALDDVARFITTMPARVGGDSATVPSSGG